MKNATTVSRLSPDILRCDIGPHSGSCTTATSSQPTFPHRDNSAVASSRWTRTVWYSHTPGTVPHVAMTLCLEAGCPNLVKRGRCPQHRKRTRGPKNQTYSTHQWRTTRARYLTAHPTSRCCGTPTEDVDHIIPRRILLAAGIHNPDADRWLQPLCKRHHSHKTATVDTPLLRRLDTGDNPHTLAEDAEVAAHRWLTALTHAH